MLLADGPSETAIRGQRFTHLGSWLYPMLKFDNSDVPTWSPNMAAKSDEGIVVYIKDYTDTDNPHSEIWGSWINVGAIPELESLSIDDLV